MEIFVGTYMRRWFSPCNAPKGPADKANLSLFDELGHKKG